MRTFLILSVSAVATLIASQQAFAGPTDILKHQLGGNRATDAANKGTGSLGGIGVPCGVSSKGAGGSILKGAGIKDSIIPSGVGGKAKDQASGAKGSQGQAQGRQTGDGVSARLMPGVEKAVKDAAASQGKAQGVESKDGATVHQTQEMKSAILKAEGSRGQETGVQKESGGTKLSPKQLQVIKATTVDPKINPGANRDSEDEKKENTKAEITKLFKPFADVAKNAKPSPMVGAMEKLLHPPKPPK